MATGERERRPGQSALRGGRMLVLAVALALGATAAAEDVMAATPLRGSDSGTVTSVKGTTFVLETKQSPSGRSKVSVSAKTSILEQKSGTRADLVRGACVVASGRKQKGGAVAADTIDLSNSAGGTCGPGVRGGRGGPGRGRPGAGRPPKPPAGAERRPPAGGGRRKSAADFGFAIGTISAVHGSTITLRAQRGSMKLTVGGSTRITKTVEVGRAAIAAGSCAFVGGTSDDKGRSVKAQEIRLSKPTSGGCSRGFPRRPAPKKQ